MRWALLVQPVANLQKLTDGQDRQAGDIIPDCLVRVE